MLAITRHRVDLDSQSGFLEQARVALAILAQRPGFVSVTVGRAVDDPDLYVITSEWEDVGSYRRALSAYDVKIGTVPLLSTAVDEPTAFEVLHRNGADGVFDSESAVSIEVVALGRPAMGEST